MKLNLLLDSPEVRSGFVNVDPFAADDDATKVKGDVVNLNHVADAGEVQELIALEVLDYVPVSQADEVLKHWLSKVARGGTITVSCVDILEVSRLLWHRLLTTDDANTLLFGLQQKPWQFKKAAYTLSVLAKTLEENGFKVISKRVNDNRAVVTANRP